MIKLADLPVPLDLSPMEAKLVEEVPREPGWRFEPKWDGFRCLAFKAKGRVELLAKSGKSLARFFPEVVERLVTSHGFAMTSDAAALARRSADMVPPSDIEVNDTGAAVILAFKYNPSWVEAVKALPRESRRFDSITKTWAVERDPDTLTALVENLSACAKVPDEKSMQALEDLRAELAPAPAGP